PVMSFSSTVTYTFVYTDSEPGRVFWGADEELSDGGLEHPPSPDYVLGPEHPPLSVKVPYVPEPEYPEYLMTSDSEAPLEDQPLPVDASPTALSPGYVADSDPKEDPKEDPEEDHADYPADGGDGEDEPSDDDDDDTNDEDEEPFEDEDDDEEEEEHLAMADSSVVPVVDPVPSAGDTEAFETNESAPTPKSPQTKVSFAQTRLRRARKTVRLEPPMSPSMEARIAEYAAAPTPPSPLLPWSSPLPQIPSQPLHVSSPPLPLPLPTVDSPTYAEAPLGYRVAEIRLRATSPSTHHPLHPSSPHLPPHVPTSLPLPSLPLPASLFIPPPVDRREDIPEAELPPHKRLCLTNPTSRIKVGESSTTAPISTGDHRADYGFIGTTDAEKQDTQDIYAVIEDGQDRQTRLLQRVDELVEDRHFHYETARLLDREAHDYRIASQESLMTTLITQVSSLQGQLSAALGQIQALQARDQAHTDDPEGDDNHNNMPPRRSSAAARAATAAAVATPMTAATVE
ncbi:hypothetical protein Tco_1179467, partial [Tanacetum coccineum]